MKKKIVIFSPYFYPEPFPINSFAKELSARNNIGEVAVITSLPNYRNYKFYNGYSFFGPYEEKLNKIIIKRIPVIPRYSNSKFAILFFYFSFFISSFFYILYFGIKNRNKYNHVITFCGSPVFVGYLGFLLSKLLNSSSSLWIQDIWPEAIETTVGLKYKKIRNLILFLQNKMFLFCDILFSESDSLSKYLIENFNKKIITLYNPARDIENNFKNINTNNKILEYSYIGNMGNAQNVELIVKCFKKAQIKNAKLNMCGDGKLLKYLSNKYNYENIIWHGWIEGKKLNSVFNSTDFLLLSLNSAGRQGLIIPSKIQTYFAKKKPILCISEGACSELILKVGCGIVCKEFEEKKVIELYRKSLDLSYEQREKMGYKSYEFYKENFVKEKIVNKFLDEI